MFFESFLDRMFRFKREKLFEGFTSSKDVFRRNKKKSKTVKIRVSLADGQFGKIQFKIYLDT